MVAAAVIGGAVISAGAGMIGSSNASSAAGHAADAQSASDKYAADIQKQIFEEQRGDLAPYRNSGNNALNQINALMGLPQTYGPSTTPTIGTGGALGTAAYTSPSAQASAPFVLKGPNGSSYPITAAQKAQFGTLPAGYSIIPSSGTPSGPTGNPNGPNSAYQTGNTQGALDANRTAATANFFTDPGYKFAVDQGVQAIDRSAASRGILNSGATLKALDTFGQGQASQQYGNYFARLQSLAGIGQTATNSGNQAAQNYANQASSLATQAGDARASGYMNSASAFNNGLSSVGNAVNSGINNWFSYAGNSGGGAAGTAPSGSYGEGGYAPTYGWA